MILGEMLVTGATAKSPWFRRLGDAATFFGGVLVQTTAMSGGGESATAQVTVAVETKSLDAPDGGEAELASATSAGLGVFKIEAASFKELVRFTYAVSYVPELDPPPEEPGFIQFRMLPPAWESNCVDAFSDLSGHLEDIRQEAT